MFDGFTTLGDEIGALIGDADAGGFSGSDFVFLDEFPTSAAPPLTTPRIAEPGPGQLNLTQTDGQFSISGAAFNFPAQSTPVWGDQGLISTASYARKAGRTLFVKLNLSTFNQLMLGFYSDLLATVNGSQFQFASTILRINDDGEVQVWNAALATGTDYTLAIAELEPAGAAYFIRGGAFTDWTLLWIGYSRNAASEFIRMSNYNSAGAVDQIRLVDRPISTATLLYNEVAAPVHNTVYAGLANAIIEMTVTAPGTITTECGFRFRYQDASNNWRLYFSTSGQFRLNSVSGGSATNRISAGGYIAAGQTRTIRVVCKESLHDIYSYGTGGSVWARPPTQANVSHLNTLTDVVPDIGAGWTVSNLRVYGWQSALYASMLDGG